ncbi:nucleotidyltransferase domain-containing protein [Bacillus sp. H-16]|uniref:nucleotidyltransferase domain-containing protein n=1 Tax=Alteribacter salitolerans TaxID=2912333 RepID=UPI0019649D3B|nr:nucleotidyltransferase domain-containing protein [Alteribacter salitolerans]MBM7095142.1 nucleotidyltransferase domain-containing protein [Alteribacter salitolerans]
MNDLRAGYGLDRNGFIVSDVNKNKIEHAYWPCIKESVAELVQLFPDRLHSVYVYGSVARGEATVQKSDLDLIALFNGPLSPVKSADLTELAKDLSKKYRSLVREVGIAAAFYDYTVDPANYYEQAFLKEISVCVHGEDLGDRFGPYRLSPEIAISFNGDIGDVLTRTRKKLDASSEKEFKKITQNFARKLIRTYYFMVMVRSRIWSTRLHEQADIVITHFPDKKPVVRTLENWLEDPPADRDAVLELIKKEGKWASDNFIREVYVSS